MPGVLTLRWMRSVGRRSRRRVPGSRSRWSEDRRFPCRPGVRTPRAASSTPSGGEEFLVELRGPFLIRELQRADGGKNVRT